MRPLSVARCLGVGFGGGSATAGTWLDVRLDCDETRSVAALRR